MDKRILPKDDSEELKHVIPLNIGRAMEPQEAPLAACDCDDDCGCDDVCLADVQGNCLWG